MVKRSERGELEFIRSIRSRTGAGTGSVRAGIGDDCAILRPPAGQELLVTTDFSLEGRHFRRDWHPPQSAGHRCLARGLSDIAAMGGTPAAAFLSLALPAGLRSTVKGRRWVSAFFDGLLTLAEATGTQLSGGDTAAAPGADILADIVCLGFAPAGSALRRSGARPGDRLYVTGALGGAAAELQQLMAHPKRFRTASPEGEYPHLFPCPRLAAGQALLRQGLATAAIDLSDGLSTDLRHLCDESRTGAIVNADALPLHRVARQMSADALSLALHGGEDYELLLTAGRTTPVPKRLGGVAMTCIGEITRDPDILLSHEGRLRPLRAAGWEHTV